MSKMGKTFCIMFKVNPYFIKISIAYFITQKRFELALYTVKSNTMYRVPRLIQIPSLNSRNLFLAVDFVRPSGSVNPAPL